MFGSPFFNSHFLNHTKVEDFQGVGHTFGAVGQRLQPGAWKFIAFITKFHFSILNALVHFAMFVDSEDFQTGTKSHIVAAAFAQIFVSRNVVSFQKGFSVFLVFFADVQRAVEAVFSARRG